MPYFRPKERIVILAGIDEAGLGPTLGPLATASAALEAPDGWLADSPWEELADAVCRAWKKGETRVAVADSKILYNTGGLAALELTVGAFSLLVRGGRVTGPELFIADAGNEGPHPCYSRELDPFPVHCAAAAVREAAENLRRSLLAIGAAAAHLRADLLYEPRLNRRYAEGLNKNEILLMETGRHLAMLVDRFASRGLAVVVDKQGGRNSYLPFLMGLFPGEWIEEVEAGAECSRYRIRRERHMVDVAFRAKGDRVSFATALASLAAKYARERAMAELNGWFCARFPELRATAGYPQDAKRWLADVGKMGGDESLVMVIRER